VDKTSYIYKLTADSYCYFLGRLRRFGKSLFPSTLKAYFLENWIQYPVFHLDLNVGDHGSVQGLGATLAAHVREMENTYKVNAAEDSVRSVSSL
jgi:hypothetical protein